MRTHIVFLDAVSAAVVTRSGIAERVARATFSRAIDFPYMCVRIYVCMHVCVCIHHVYVCMYVRYTFSAKRAENLAVYIYIYIIYVVDIPSAHSLRRTSRATGYLQWGREKGRGRERARARERERGR